MYSSFLAFFFFFPSFLVHICLADSASITDYAPRVNVECPDLSTTSLIRTFTPDNQTLHQEEVRYVLERESNVIPGAWTDWLGNGSGIGYDLSKFQGKFPRIGMANPGGGLRAALFAAASINALDSRNSSAKAAGTGGLLQVTTYMTGLSGGSWVLGSFVFNDWPTAKDLVFGNGRDQAGWLLDLPLVTPDGVDIASTGNEEFFESILTSVQAKGQSGVYTSITDPWSRMISFHFLNTTTRDNFFTNATPHGAGQLWSDIPLIPSFQNRQSVFPIALVDSRPAGSNLTTTLPLDSVVYEMTPFEFASFDPSLSAAMNMTYVGTQLVNGKSENGSSCVLAFDQAGFIMGSSASLFNQIVDFATNTINGFTQSDSDGLLSILSSQLQEVRSRAADVANWPNPFAGLGKDTYQDTNADTLELIDGASNQENVPYGPLFVKARALDVIVTIEGSADTSQAWPNGTGPIFTTQRLSTLLNSSHQQFPPIPATADDFVSTGVNGRPTFFGCDPQSPTDYPLVIYLPNVPPINGDDPVTNTATFKLSYTKKHTQLFFDAVYANTVAGFTPNENKPDPNWGACIQCAAIDRARTKVTPTIPRSTKCQRCFQQYCFDPSHPPSKSVLVNRKLDFVDPDPTGVSQVLSFFDKNKIRLIGGLIGLVVFVILLVLGIFWLRKYKLRKKVVLYRKINEYHLTDIDNTL